MRVRESAAQQIEERQSDWAYSRPIVVLDLVWNLAFVLVSIAVLIMSRKEKPVSPLRLWIVGYCCQCVLHMVCVAVEYKRRYYQLRFEADERLEAAEGSGGGGGGWWSSRNSNSSLGSDVGEDGDYVSQRSQNDDETRYYSILLPIKLCSLVSYCNTFVSFDYVLLWLHSCFGLC